MANPLAEPWGRLVTHGVTTQCLSSEFDTLENHACVSPTNSGAYVGIPGMATLPVVMPHEAAPCGIGMGSKLMLTARLLVIVNGKRCGRSNRLDILVSANIHLLRLQGSSPPSPPCRLLCRARVTYQRHSMTYPHTGEE